MPKQETKLALLCICVVFLCGQFGVGEANGAETTTLPYANGFESDSVGQLSTSSVPWDAVNNAGVTVVSSPTATGNRAARNTNDYSELILRIDESEDYTNTVCEMYVRLDGYQDAGGSDAPDAATDPAVALFYVCTNKDLKVWSSNQWVTLVSNVQTQNWIAFAVHLYYDSAGSGLWDLYMSDNGVYGSDLTKRNNAHSLGFNTSVSRTELTEMNIAGKANIDAINLSVANSGVGSGSPTNWDAYPVVSDELISLALSRNYSSTHNTLAGALGDAIRAGIPTGSTLKIFYTNNQWNTYTAEAGYWDDTGAIPVEDMHITPSLGVLVTLASGNTDGNIFIYENDGVGPTNVDLKGTDHAVSGWNLLGWPHTSAAPAGDDWGFSSIAQEGDRVYVYDSDHVGNWVKLHWDTNDTCWKRGTEDYSMGTEKAFFFRSSKVGPDVGTWNPPQ